MVSGLAMSLATAQDRPVITLPTPGGTGGGEGASKVEPFRTGLEDTDTRTTPPGARVSFNLEDADLPDLVRIVSRITGKRFILPSKARSIKATVYSPSDVTAAEAYQAFLSILSLNGLSLEPSGRYYKIIETSGAESHGFPMYEDGETMPADDRFVTRMHRVANVSAEDVATLLTHFKTSEGAITAYAPTNTLIITDTAANVRRMLRIVSQIDIPRTGEQIWVEPIHYAVATELAERLREVYPVEDGSSAATPAPAEGRRGRRGAAKAPATREGDADAAATPTSSTVGASSGGEARVRNIIADERTNALIIMATERAYLQLLELIRVLDVAVEGEGSVHVYELQYADAENMAEVLGSLIEGGGSSGSSGGAGAATKRAASATAGEGADAVAGSFSGGDISIAAYKETNALIVTASATDYAALRRVIAELDVAPRQVFIEAVIMELQIQRSSRLGVSYHGGIPEPNVDGSAGLSVLGFGAANSIGFPASALAGDTLTGLALGVRGPNLPTIPGIGLSIPSFGVVLSALADSSDADVLATPHLIAMDNIEAEINVGANVPLQTSGLGGALGNSLGALAGGAGAAGAAGGLAGLAGLSGLAGGLGGGVARQTVGITLRMTPHINDAGEIRLEIEEEISEAGAPQGTLGVVPIEQRTAKTQVLVRDQETVVIGGLMRDRVTTSETKVPILGDIPILGALFRTTSRTTERRNLLLFLTPYIIRGPDDLRAIFERKMQERQEFLDRFFVFGDHEYTPPFDYSRTRGLVLEIFNELEEVDEERVLEAELESRPPPEHTARAPLGVASPYDDALGDEGDLVIGPEGELDLSEPAPVVAEPAVEEGEN